MLTTTLLLLALTTAAPAPSSERPSSQTLPSQAPSPQAPASQPSSPQAASPAKSDASLPAGAEAWSLFGTPLTPPAPSADALKDLEAKLAEAKATLAAKPSDPDALIWVGRRTAYLGRYRDAIDVFTQGIAKFPRDARFYRHRGHRYITTRQFDRAIADFEKAAALVEGKPDEVEPDGQPNARNIPTSTLQFNIWYHLGLAHYLSGHFDRALDAYRSCMDVSKNPDAVVATTHWLYMTLRRLNRQIEAARVLTRISAQAEVIENAAYHRLVLMYKGELKPEALLDQASSGLDKTTVTYGVANWHFYNNRRQDALKLLRTIVPGPQWAAFGAIAAEADLKRLGVTPSPAP